MDDAPGWTIDELTHRAALALALVMPAGDRGSAGGGARARQAPDQRAIRWYTGTGLVDRPIGGRGRGARYGVRHLSQLVAIRRLQGEGWSLADIQGRLAGADAESLAALAALPPEVLVAEPLARPMAAPLAAGVEEAPAAGPGAVSPAARAPRGPRTDLNFWAPGALPVTAELAALPGDPRPRHEPSLLGAVRLAEGVLLVLPRQPSRSDLPALAVAAAPLLEALTALGLVPAPSPSAHPTPGAP
jgi:DNA-binding transcriptional MerR regulator